jgi:Flp pilus assembly protein protease CpaA
VFAEALASFTFILVAYQDFKERMVSDWVWIPAAIAIPVSIWESGNLWWLAASKLSILAVAAIATYFLGVFGQADSIALFFMGVGTSYLSPLPQLIGMSIASLVHISYLALRSGSIRIEKFMSVEEAERQNVWIPREIESEGVRVQLSSSPEEAWDSLKKYEGSNAMVKVSYGVPLAGYMAIGYTAAFIALVLKLI